MKYKVECFADGNSSGVAENSYMADDSSAVAGIVGNCTRKVAGIGKVVVTILAKDDREEVIVATKPPSKMDEQILVFSSDALAPFGMKGKTGVLFGSCDQFLESDGYVETLAFRRRGDVEEDESLKQPIPYWVIVDPSQRSQAMGEDKVLCYVRGKKSGENRLVMKASIGIGGHISEADVAVSSFHDRFERENARRMYEFGALRELNEELKITSPCESSVVALLNDERTPVGRVHFGLIHVLVLADPAGVGPNEDDVITKFSWKTVDELRGMYDSLEGWSQLCLDNIIPIIRAAKDIAAREGWRTA